MSKNGTITNRPASIADRLSSDLFKQEIARVLPRHVTPERMARVALTALRRVPKLAQCSQESFFKAMMDCSQWGLEPDGRRAHLIPYGKECQLIIDYKGLVELVMRTGKVASIHADVVCENDDFDYDRGEVKRHRIDFRMDRGEPYAAYCIVRLADCGEKCEVMSRHEIEGIRKRSKAGRSGPWVTDWSEMAKKTVFRRCSKWLPMDAEIRDAFEGDDEVLTARARPTHQLTAESVMASLDQPAEPESKVDEKADDAPPEPWEIAADNLESELQCGDAESIKDAFGVLEATKPPVDWIKELGDRVNERCRELMQ